MERLTFVDEDGQILFDNPAGFPKDIGFTIRELAENEEWETLDNIAQRLANCEQRLKHYEDLEEQGKLLKTPCAVGDMVYTILPHDSHFTVAQINKIEIKSTIYGKMCCFIEPVAKRGHLYRFFENDFGKTVFLTREEAEAALKGL